MNNIKSQWHIHVSVHVDKNKSTIHVTLSTQVYYIEQTSQKQKKKKKKMQIINCCNKINVTKQAFEFQVPQIRCKPITRYLELGNGPHAIIISWKTGEHISTRKLAQS